MYLEGELPTGGVGLEGGQRVVDAEFLAQQGDHGAQVLQGDAAGAVLAQVAGFDELAPGDGVGSGALLADHRGVGHADAFVTIYPAAQAVGAQPEEPCGVAHAVDRTLQGCRGPHRHGGQSARWTNDPPMAGFHMDDAGLLRRWASAFMG